MKKIFEKTKKLARESRLASTKLWEEITEYLGFEPNPYKLDSLVDTIEQGTGAMNYEEFIQILDNYKKEEDLK